MRRAVLRATILTLLAVVVAGCGSRRARDAAEKPGAPLAGLADAERQRFDAGYAIFTREFTPAEGLGPLFIERRCSNCHGLPTVGGTGVETVTKATRFQPGRCDVLDDEGGPVIQNHATPLLEAAGVRHESAPKRATAASTFMPPTLYGVGLVEAIPEEQILAFERAQGRDGADVAGRAARTADGRVTRFGRKAEFATLAELVEGAVGTEIGLTTPRNPTEQTINGRPLPPGTDPVADPEVTQAMLDTLADYIRLLAPPAREPATGASRDTLARGERLFDRIGCADCHVARMTTGRNASPSLDHRSVSLYSDLLLHDMGPALADVCTPTAPPSFWRTAPLMGIHLRTMYLHDGRARTIDAAILAHDGESRKSRDKYLRRDPAERNLLIRFVRSL